MMNPRHALPATQPRTDRAPYLEIRDVGKSYATPGGPYRVLEGVDLSVCEGELVCVVGHSGCGKTTLLNMVSGFATPSTGRVTLDGVPIRGPGPDRMVVFQGYALLPWLTVFENVELAVKAVHAEKSKARQNEIVLDHLALVGLEDAAGRYPRQISGGMKQRVAIARALAVQPKVLILDEPFGALDAITKEELQEQLLTIWNRARCTLLMITHDIDEALFLADRLVLMTNGPAATIGEIIEIPFPRPRNRERILEDPAYYRLRNRVLEYLYERFATHEAA